MTTYGRVFVKDFFPIFEEIFAKSSIFGMVRFQQSGKETCNFLRFKGEIDVLTYKLEANEGMMRLIRTQ